MPLKAGKSRATISSNIRELSHSQTAAGKRRNASPTAHEQNVAIALSKAHYARKGKR
jgi:hypothetical protein